MTHLTEITLMTKKIPAIGNKQKLNFDQLVQKKNIFKFVTKNVKRRIKPKGMSKKSLLPKKMALIIKYLIGFYFH